MHRYLLFVACVVGSLAFMGGNRSKPFNAGPALAHAVSAAQATPGFGGDERGSICSSAAANQNPADAPVAAAEMPPGVVFTTLASGVMNQTPDAPVEMVLKRFILQRGEGTATYLAKGPLLYYVESGTLSYVLDGVPSSSPAGTSFIVQIGSLYSFSNQQAEPVSLVRSGLVPLGEEDGQIMVVPTAMPTTSVSPPSPPESELLVRAVLPASPPLNARIFLGCLEWDRVDAVLDGRASMGPTGVLVERGQVHLDQTYQLKSGFCQLLSAVVPHRLAPEVAPTSLRVFGVVPEGSVIFTASEQSESDVSDSHPDVQCGEGTIR